MKEIRSKDYRVRKIMVKILIEFFKDRLLTWISYDLVFGEASLWYSIPQRWWFNSVDVVWHVLAVETWTVKRKKYFRWLWMFYFCIYLRENLKKKKNFYENNANISLHHDILMGITDTLVFRWVLLPEQWKIAQKKKYDVRRRCKKIRIVGINVEKEGRKRRNWRKAEE